MALPPDLLIALADALGIELRRRLPSAADVERLARWYIASDGHGASSAFGATLGSRRHGEPDWLLRRAQAACWLDGLDRLLQVAELELAAEELIRAAQRMRLASWRAGQRRCPDARAAEREAERLLTRAWGIRRSRAYERQLRIAQRRMARNAVCAEGRTEHVVREDL